MSNFETLFCGKDSEEVFECCSCSLTMAAWFLGSPPMQLTQPIHLNVLKVLVRMVGPQEILVTWHPLEEKTRCSPQTRMQSRRTLLCNKLFKQSCAFFPRYSTTGLWSAEGGGVQSVESKVWSAECPA